MKQKRVITAPFGYKMKPIPEDSVKQVLIFCMSLSDDPDFIRNVALDTHKGRLKALKHMGFELEEI